MSIETYLSALSKCRHKMGVPAVVSFDKKNNVVTYYLDNEECKRLSRIAVRIETKIIRLVKKAAYEMAKRR